MSFTKHRIQSKVLCIIDIWSYKLRVCAARFKNKKIEILGYSEKRQDISYFANQECLNLPGLCDNISEAIEKLETMISFPLENIIMNYPFWELFLGSKRINYKRDHPHDKITLSELESIMESIEKLCLKSLNEEIDKFYGLSEKEIQILLSRVNSISIDGKNHEKIIGKSGENMKISLLNAFIPTGKHTLLSQIGNVIEKNISRVLPTEYCITKIFSQEDIIIINIWATQTTVSLKLEGDVIGISKVPIGINDLVNKISKQHHDTREEIIENLKTEAYNKEKIDFLQIWWESIGITLNELLGGKICPQYFYIGGGWWNNKFIQEYLEGFHFAKYDIRIISDDISFVKEEMSDILKAIKHIKLEDIQRIPLDMYVLLLETNHMIAREKDLVSNSLKTAIKRLWYLKS